MSKVNHNLVLIEGKSATGKSASLMNLKDPTGVIYLNCEAGKELPFPAKFQIYNVVDPKQVRAAVQKAEDMDEIHTIVIDSLTFMMDMYESVYCVDAKDGRKAWGQYAQFFKKLMMKDVASSSKNIIFMGHTMDVLNESERIIETRVKVKGSLMNQGIESYFCNVIAAKKMPVKALMVQNPLLTITPHEQAVGFKYIFQTQLTKDTINEAIRGPIGLWDTDHTYIDNDVQKVLDHLHAYYS